MKKKLLLMFISAFLLTGCSVNYKITVGTDKTVTEEIIATEPLEFYLNRKYQTIDNVVSGMIDYNQKYLDSVGAHYSYYDLGDNYGAKLITSYKSLDEYSKKSKAINQVFEKLDYREDTRYIYLETNGKVYMDTYSINRYNIESVNVIINVPYKVVSSNAKECTEDGGMYKCVWEITKKSEMKSINMKLDKMIGSASRILYLKVIIGVACAIIVFVIFKAIAFRGKVNKV